jgi:hypothetical protein
MWSIITQWQKLSFAAGVLLLPSTVGLVKKVVWNLQHFQIHGRACMGLTNNKQENVQCRSNTGG